MTPGELVQFLIYAIMVAGAVASLSEVWGALQSAAGATERLVELLTSVDPILDPDAPLPVPNPAEGRIAFENVTFRYPARPEVKALDGLDLEIRPGETVALVGPSGAGKTTIFQLLLRFFDPDNGVVRLDGVPLNAMAREEMRKVFALVPQDPVIFATTARENIRFGQPDATDAEVEAAARAQLRMSFWKSCLTGMRATWVNAV